MKPDKGRIRLMTTVPGATRLGPLLSDFSKNGGGIVTSFSERLLHVVHGLIESDDLEPLPFAEVVSRFVTTTGGESGTIAAGALVREALAGACSDLPQDSPFAVSAKFHGTHKAILRTLEELHEADIRLDSVGAAVLNGDSGRLQSLANLDREVRAKLESLGRTTLSTLIDECTANVVPCKLDRLLVFAGSGLCARNLRWLQWAAACGSRVTLVTERHAATAPLFAASSRAARILQVEPSKVGEGSGLLVSLFGEFHSTDPKPEVVHLVAPDRLAECEWAIRGCLQERVQGTEANRIAVFARNLEEYAPLLESAGKRLGVPLGVPRRVPLLSNRFAKLLLQIVTFLAQNDVRALVPVVRSTYVGLNLSDQGLACEALKTAYRGKGSQWQELQAWATDAGNDFAWLRGLLTWRGEAMKQRCGLRDWIGRLRNLVDVLPVSPFESGPTSKRDTRAQNVMQRLLYHLASVEPDRYSSLTLSDFQRVCLKIWTEADVSLPDTPEAVKVVDSADSLGAVDVVFVLGMLEGVFPRRRSEDPILTDAERHKIRAAAKSEWLKDSHDKAREERDEFYRLCAGAGRKLVLSYPETDDQRENVPAFYLSEVERAVGGREYVKHLSQPRSLLTPELLDCISAADLNLAQALLKPSVDSPANTLISEAARSAVAWSDSRPLAPKDLADALECPFRFFVRRQLNVTTNRPSSRWNSLRKLPQIVSLVTQAEPSDAQDALWQALDRSLDDMLSELAPWELSMLRAGGRRLILDWVRREFAARKLWRKSEDSLRTKVGFNDAGFRAKISSKLELAGGVPAASKLGPYKVSHLYESRSPDRDHESNLSDPDFVYYGLHLLAQYEPGVGSALEVETMGGERTLYLLPRLSGSSYPSNVTEGLKVVDLSTRDDPRESVEDFFRRLKERVKRASETIRELQTEANPGEPCLWCDMGELCRRSQLFGEEDPFGPQP